MVELPSLADMPPETWLAEMNALRAELIDQAATILDLRTTPDGAAAPLERLFAPFRESRIDATVTGHTPDEELSIEVQPSDDALFFWVYPTEDYVSIVYTDAGFWWFEHKGPGSDGRTRHEIHREVASHLLGLMPWGNDDDLAELAAIETGSGAGE